MALTTDQIKQNVEFLKGKGLPEQEIDRYLDQQGLSSEYQEKIDAFKRFDESPIGKFMRGTNKTLGFIPKLLGMPGGTDSDEFLKKSFRDEVKGKSFLDRSISTLKDIAKEGGQSGLAATQLLTSEVGTPVKALQGLQKARQIGQFGLTQAGIQGTLGTGKRVLEGQELPEAAKGGAIEGATNLALITSLPAFGELIKKSANSLMKASSNVRNFAIDRAMKNPKILTETQPSVIDVGESMLDSLSQFADNTKIEFQNKLDQIQVPEGLAIDVSPIRDLIKGKRLDANTLTSKLKTQRTNNLLDLEDNVIDRFVQGGNLSFDEARTINSLLFDIVDTGINPELGSGAIGKISNIKKTFLGLMDDQVPGIKDANKYFAENTKFYQDALKDISKKTGDLKEGALNIMGQRKTGLGTAGRTKSQELARLEKLDDIMGTKHVDQLADSLVAEEFEKIGMSNLMETIRFGGSAGLGALIGSSFGPVGAGVGAAVGSGVSGALRSPEATRKMILGAKATEELLEGVSPLVRQGLQRIGRMGRVASAQQLTREDQQR